MQTRSSGNHNNIKECTPMCNNAPTHVPNTDQNCAATSSQSIQCNTITTATKGPVPTKANKLLRQANATPNESTQGPPKKTKVTQTTGADDNISKNTNEATVQPTLAVQEYFLDCKKCQEFWLDNGFRVMTIKYNFESQLWNSGYNDKTMQKEHFHKALNKKFPVYNIYIYISVFYRGESNNNNASLLF
jgi:hypothetical protein